MEFSPRSERYVLSKYARGTKVLFELEEKPGIWAGILKILDASLIAWHVNKT